MKKSRWQDFKETMFYDENRELLSRTALFSFCYFMLSIITIIIGVVLFVIVVMQEKEFKATAYVASFFTFVAGLTGSGFVTYSYSKVLNLKKQSQDTTINQSNEAGPQ